MTAGTEGKITESPDAPTKQPRLRKNGEVDKRSLSSASNGAKGGRPLTRLDPEVLVEAAKAVMASRPKADLLKDFHLTDRQATFLMQTAGMTREEFRDRLSADMDIALGLLLSLIIEDVHALEPRDRPIAFGILNDHQLKMRGYGPPATINQTNIQINGLARSEAITALLSGKLGAIPEAVKEQVDGSNCENLIDSDRFTQPLPIEEPARAPDCKVEEPAT